MHRVIRLVVVGVVLAVLLTTGLTDCSGSPGVTAAVSEIVRWPGPLLGTSSRVRSRYGHGRYLFNKRLKSEGYGIVRVKHDEEAFGIECWPRDVDPTNRDAEQFPGWPYRLPFDETAGQ